MSPWAASSKEIWLDTGLMAFDSSHVACLIIGIILVVAFGCLLVVTNLLAINRVADPSGKQNLLAQAHGNYTRTRALY
jgi:hypothetical protein